MRRWMVLLFALLTLSVTLTVAQGNSSYVVRYGDTLYRIARDTGNVVTVIGPIGDFGY